MFVCFCMGILPKNLSGFKEYHGNGRCGKCNNLHDKKHIIVPEGVKQ